MSFQPNPNRIAAAQDTLANMPSGTSFVQQARAAELKAARSRKRATEKFMAEVEEVPEVGPVNLLDYQVMTRKNARAKIKSASNATTTEEPPSRPSSSETSLQQRVQPHQIAQQGTVQQYGGTEYGTSMPYRPELRQPTSGVGAYTRYLTENANSASRVLTPELSGLQHSPPPDSELSTIIEGVPDASESDTSAQQRYVEMSRSNSYGQYPPLGTPASSLAASRHVSNSTQQSRPQDGMALGSKAVLGRDGKENEVPIFISDDKRQLSGQQYRNDGMEDPFVTQQYRTAAFTPDPESTYHPRANVRMPPPAVKGTATSAEQRYNYPSRVDQTIYVPTQPNLTRNTSRTVSGPPSYPPPNTTLQPNPTLPPMPSLAGQVSKRPEEYAEFRALNDPKIVAANKARSQLSGGGSSTHPRDPHPYTGFAVPSNKTELLMQSIERLTSENTGGGRTVLYDPVTSSSASRKTSFHSEAASQVATTGNGRTATRPSGLDLRNTYDPAHDYSALDTGATIKPIYRNGAYMLPPSAPGGGETATGFAETIAPSSSSADTEEHHHQQQSGPHPHPHPNADEAYDYVYSGEEETPLQREDRILTWFTTGHPQSEEMREILLKRELMSLLPVSRRTSGQILAPIGSGRRSSSGVTIASGMSSSTPSRTGGVGIGVGSGKGAGGGLSDKNAGIDVMAPILSNLAVHQRNDHTNPFTKYSAPPAWCVDTTMYGNNSLLGENEWRPPRRVGRDPRYPVQYLDGRVTRFEDVMNAGGAGLTPERERERESPASRT